MLQASMNPLLANYEHAQNLAGEAFADLGIRRGRRDAEARRVAKAAGEQILKKRLHVPSSAWRAEQLKSAKAEADMMTATAAEQARRIVADGLELGKAVVKKSRKRAIAEARKIKAQAAREAALQQRHLDALSRQAAQMRSATEMAGEDLKVANAAICAGAAKLTEINKEVHQGQIAAQQVKSETIRNNILQSAAQAGAEEAEKQRTAEEAALAATRLQRQVEETRLKDAQPAVSAAQAHGREIESVVTAIEDGIDLISEGALQWGEQEPDQAASLEWGRSVLQDNGEREDLLSRIKPARTLIERIAKMISEMVRSLLSVERSKLARDAAFVA